MARAALMRCSHWVPSWASKPRGFVVSGEGAKAQGVVLSGARRQMRVSQWPIHVRLWRLLIDRFVSDYLRIQGKQEKLAPRSWLGVSQPSCPSTPCYASGVSFSVPERKSRRKRLPRKLLGFPLSVLIEQGVG
jgi:hypothetical protein